MNPVVSIVIVNYLCIDDVLDCISSIREKADVDYEIIVVSNSEWQRDIKALETEYPDVKWLETGYNAGYSVANNMGAKVARGEYLFFLNPDTTFKNGVLSHLISCSEEHNACIVGPYVEYPDGSPQPTVKFHFHPMMHVLLAFRFIEKLFPARFSFLPILPKQSQPVDVVNGCALFITKSVFFELGEFAPRYFMYYEENDVCLRAQHAGENVFFCNKAHITHFENKTTRNVRIPMELVRVNSQRIFLKTFYPKWLLWDRVWGVIAYGPRIVYSLFLLRRSKIEHFYSLFRWYLFTYS